MNSLFWWDTDFSDYTNFEKLASNILLAHVVIIDTTRILNMKQWMHKQNAWNDFK